MRKGIIFLCVVWVGYLPTAAQPDLIRFDSLTIDQGFPASRVFSFLRDTRGFMWFGTQDGLVRYDGVDYQLYYPDKNDSTQLYQSHVFYLFEDSQGRIWLSAGIGSNTDKTVQVFDPKTEKFTRMNFNSFVNVWWYNQLNAQNYFLEDEEGNIWVKCYKTGLYKIENPSLHQYAVTNYKVSSDYPQDASADSVSVLFMDSRQKFWVGTRNGLYLFDRGAEKFIRFADDKEGKPDQVTGIVEDKKGNLWVNYERKGLYLLNPDTKEFIEKWPEPNPTPSWFNARYLLLDNADNLWMLGQRDSTYLHASLDRYDINTGEVSRYFESGSESVTLWHFFHQIDQEGNIWASVFYKGGIYLYNPDARSFELVSQLRPGGVHNFYFDRYKNIWVTDWERGLWKFHYSNQKMKILSHEPLRGNVCIEDHQGNIVMASSKGGIIRYTLNAAREVVEKEYILKEINCGNLIQDKSGKLWASCTNQETIELVSIDLASHDINRFPLPPHLESIRSVTEIPHQGIMVGSRSNGLFYYEYKTGEITQFLHDPDDSTSISTNILNRIIVDGQNRAWVYNQVGFHLFDVDRKNFVRIDPGGILEKFENVYEVYAHKNGQFWIGGVYGLSLYEPMTGKIHQSYLVKDDFPTKDIQKIIRDDAGNLWLGANSGLVCFNVKEEQFKTYDTTDGLPSNGIQAACKRANGELVFGTFQGSVIFHPDQLPINEQPPNPVFTELRLFNEKVAIDGKVLSKSIAYSNEIVLSHDQNVISFTYSALSFANPAKNQYAYFMEGVDKDWNYVGNQTFASYAGLPFGKYTLSLKASNNDGLWNETPATLQVTILPPWWQTGWAYALYALLAFGLLLSIRRYEIKRLKLRQRAIHLAEVDTLKTRFFANISHEFRTPLTLILGPVKQLMAMYAVPEAQPYLNGIQRNAQRLLHLVNQLLDLSKLEAGKLKLEAVKSDIVSFLKARGHAFSSLAESKSIHFSIELPEEKIGAYFDRDKLEKIINNLLSNAFKFTQEGGAVSLKGQRVTQHSQDWMQILIADSGKGIPAEEVDKIYDRFYQVDSSHTREQEGSGIGLALTKELVELHHGVINVESKAGKGTTFTLLLPLGKAHLKEAEIIQEMPLPEEETGMTESKLHPSDLMSYPQENFLHEDEDTAQVSEKPVVLIVEDHQEVRAFIRDSIGDQYQVQEAENGKVGVAMAKELLPDLIISDVMMPSMDMPEIDGYELCEKIKTDELTSHIPVILLTAKADRKSKLTGLETGADDYLAKPFDGEELQLIIRNRIEERRVMREKFSKDITLEPRHIAVSSLDEQFLTKVLDIIEQHMEDESFTIEDLSQQAGYSRMHFYRKLKALSGQTPSQFLRTIRLKRAAALLQQKSDTISQVAYRVGFSSLSYFNKCFKDQFGITPKQYAAFDQEIE